MAENKAKLWSKRIKEWALSGISQKKWCDKNGLSYWAFKSWRTKFLRTGENASKKRKGANKKQTTVEWMEVPTPGVIPTPEKASVEIRIKDYTINIQASLDEVLQAIGRC